MPDYSDADLRLIADVARGVYGRPVEIEGIGNTKTGEQYDWPCWRDSGWHTVPDFLGDDSAALGLLEKLAADGRVGEIDVFWDHNRWYCQLVCKPDRGSYRADASIAGVDGSSRRRAIVLTVDALLKAEEEAGHAGD